MSREPSTKFEGSTYGPGPDCDLGVFRDPGQDHLKCLSDYTPSGTLTGPVSQTPVGRTHTWDLVRGGDGHGCARPVIRTDGDKEQTHRPRCWSNTQTTVLVSPY